MDSLRLVKAYTVDEIRGIATSAARGIEVVLWPSRKRYLFNPGSTAADDGDQVIAPAVDAVECGDCCASMGRWELEFTPPVTVLDSGLTILEAEDVAGHDGSGGADITDATLTFTLSETKSVAIFGEATANTDFALRTSAALAINIDGTPYPGTTASSSTLGSGQVSAVVAFKFVTLAAGTHTIKLVGGGSIGVISNAGNPTRLMVIYR